MTPDCVIVVATVRALKMHGGGPPVIAGQYLVTQPTNHPSSDESGKPLDHAYGEENTDLVKRGCCNLVRHIENVRKFGVPIVVAINRFSSDTEAELDVVQQSALDAS